MLMDEHSTVCEECKPPSRVLSGWWLWSGQVFPAAGDKGRPSQGKAWVGLSGGPAPGGVPPALAGELRAEALIEGLCHLEAPLPQLPSHLQA